MPIIHLADTEDKANELGINVHRIDCNNDGKVISWTYETHHGLCISDRERNGYSDSDWYMTVWNHDKQAPEEICFASTRGWSYPCYGSCPDATPDVMRLYRAWKADRDLKARIAEDRKQAQTPAPGKLVEVVAGRKYKKGTCFEVRSTEKSAFGRSKYGTWDNREMIAYCYCLDSAGNRDMTKALAVIPFPNLAVVNPDKYLTALDMQQLESQELWFVQEWMGHVFNPSLPVIYIPLTARPSSVPLPYMDPPVPPWK